MTEREQLVFEIIQSLRQSPEDWKWVSDGYYEIRHKSGIVVWVANGEFKMENPYRHAFSGFTWWKLRRAFKRWKKIHGLKLRSAEREAGFRQALAMIRGETRLKRAA